MHRVLYTRAAKRSLRRIAKDRIVQIMSAIDEIAELDNPISH